MKILFLSCHLFFLTKIVGQPLNSSDSFPPPGGSFIYHPASKTLLLISGDAVIPDSLQSNIWSWNGKKWSIVKAYGPGSRDFFPAAVNTKTGFIHSFGGITTVNDHRQGDLWTSDGKKWFKIITNDIGTRDHHCIAYADHLNAFVLYGGQTADRGFDTTTWLLRNGQFIPLHIPGPGIRYHSAMAYDKQRKKVVLYGGGEKPGEHWEFDGIKWTKILTEESPGKRLYHLMVYDENLRMIILHGGWQNQNPRDSINNLTPTTWAWNGIKWKQIASERIFATAMGYDVQRKVIVAFGRNDNSLNSDLGLWEFKDGRWMMKANYGKWNAYNYVKQWVQEHPDDMQALAKFADMLEWQTKEFPEAEIAYKKILRVHPERTSMLIDLALVLLMQSKAEEAEVFLSKANDAGLMNRNAYGRLGGLLRQEKRYRESIRYLEKALQLEPKGNDFYSLACNYANIDDTEKAFENLNKAADNGYNAKQRFEQSPELQALRNDSRWQGLLEKLK